jgi:hypothetical protein
MESFDTGNESPSQIVARNDACCTSFDQVLLDRVSVNLKPDRYPRALLKPEPTVPVRKLSNQIF